MATLWLIPRERTSENAFWLEHFDASKSWHEHKLSATRKSEISIRNNAPIAIGFPNLADAKKKTEKVD